MPDELKTVRSCGDTIEAELIKGQLVAAGIPAVVMGGEVPSSLFPGLGSAFGGIKVQVAEEDLERALEILGQQEEPVLDDDWESTTDFQTSEAVHGLTGSQQPATEPERSITAAVRPDADQSFQAVPTVSREVPADGGHAVAEPAGLRDVEIGPNEVAARALKVGAIGVLATPVLLFFLPFFFWLLLFLACQLYSTFLLAKLAAISEDLEPPALRKMYGALAFNMVGWVELAAMLILLGRVLMLLRLL